MGFRFQKRIKLLPGVTLNLSKSGVSTSLGPRGAKITLGHGQTRVTTGIPGSGISHSTITKNKKTEYQKQALLQQPITPARPPRPAYYKFGQFLGRLWERVFGNI